MNEIREWVLSLWDRNGNEPATRKIEMTNYSYEPIQDVKDEKEVKDEKDVKTKGIAVQRVWRHEDPLILYFGVEEGKPYIRIDNGKNGNIYKVTILSCKMDNHTRTIRYYCAYDTEIVFSRVSDYMDVFVKKNDIIYLFFLIMPPFKISLDNDMISKMEYLFSL